MKALATILALAFSSAAFAGGGGSVSTSCRNDDRTQFVGFEQNIAWFSTGQTIETYYNLTTPSGKVATGADRARILENSANTFEVGGQRLAVEIEFLNGDFGPAVVTAHVGGETIQFKGTCDVE